MERTRKFLLAELLLSLGGVLFSGYLSFSNLLTGVCAFNEPCPYFLGYPACWYGFAMFLALFGVSLAGFIGKLPAQKAGKYLTGISALGIVFAGAYVVQEVYGWLSVGRFQGYGLGLPTCVYGLVFYVLVFVIAAVGLMRNTAAPIARPPEQPAAPVQE